MNTTAIPTATTPGPRVPSSTAPAPRDPNEQPFERVYRREVDRDPSSGRGPRHAPGHSVARPDTPDASERPVGRPEARDASDHSVTGRPARDDSGHATDETDAASSDRSTEARASRHITHDAGTHARQTQPPIPVLQIITPMADIVVTHPVAPAASSPVASVDQTPPVAAPPLQFTPAQLTGSGPSDRRVAELARAADRPTASLESAIDPAAAALTTDATAKAPTPPTQPRAATLVNPAMPGSTMAPAADPTDTPPATTPLPPAADPTDTPPATTPLPPAADPTDTPPATTPLPPAADPTDTPPATTPLPPTADPTDTPPATTPLPPAADPTDTPPATTPRADERLGEPKRTPAPAFAAEPARSADAAVAADTADTDSDSTASGADTPAGRSPAPQRGDLDRPIVPIVRQAPNPAAAPGDPAPNVTHVAQQRAAAHAEANEMLARAELRRVTHGGSHLNLETDAGDLGVIRIEATDRGSGLQLQLGSDRQGTRTVLGEHLHELRDQMRADGFDLSSLDVGAGSGGRHSDGPPAGAPDAPPQIRTTLAADPTRPAGAPTLPADLATGTDGIDLRI